MEVEVSRDGFSNAAVMYATNLQQMRDTSSRWNILITKVAYVALCGLPLGGK